MSEYVDGYVIPVPTQHLDAYRKLAKISRDVWLELGALDYQEWVADDVPDGTLTSFPLAVQKAADETVVFAYVTYRSKQDRERINAAAMQDPRLADWQPETMPFDGKRMIYGGFKPLHEN